MPPYPHSPTHHPPYANPTRERRITVIFGQKGMGKSAVAKDMVRRYRQASAARGEVPVVIILDPRRQWAEGEWPVGGMNKKVLHEWVGRITGYGGEQPQQRIPKYGALVVLDDADKWLPLVLQDPLWLDLWTGSRHYHADLIVTCHRPALISKELIAEADELIIFSMGEAGAIEYFSKVPSVKPHLRHIPAQQGKALRVVQTGPNAPRAEIVEFFKPVPGHLAPNRRFGR